MSIDMPTLHIRMVLKNHQQWDMAAQFRKAALPGENRITVNRGWHQTFIRHVLYATVVFLFCS